MGDQRRGANIFQIEQEGDTIVLMPLLDLSTLAYHEIEEGAGDILELMEHTPVKNVVLDLCMTTYYGSSALGFFVKLWKRVSQVNGRMVFCNASDYEKETLRITRLDLLWPIYSSRREALAAIRN